MPVRPNIGDNRIPLARSRGRSRSTRRRVVNGIGTAGKQPVGFHQRRQERHLFKPGYLHSHQYIKRKTYVVNISPANAYQDPTLHPPAFPPTEPGEELIKGTCDDRSMADWLQASTAGFNPLIHTIRSSNGCLPHRGAVFRSINRGREALLTRADGGYV